MYACSAKTVGPKSFIFGSSPCILHLRYISVSISTPLAVTGPHGQLASLIITSHSGLNYWSLKLVNLESCDHKREFQPLLKLVKERSNLIIASILFLREFRVHTKTKFYSQHCKWTKTLFLSVCNFVLVSCLIFTGCKGDGKGMAR